MDDGRRARSRAAIAAGRADHRPRRLRRRRGLRDDDHGLDPARARRRLRLADPRPDRRRLRARAPRTSSGWPQRGTALLVTVDCGITAVEEVRAGAGAGDGGRSSPTTTSRATSCPTARSCTRRSAAIRSSRSAGRRSPGSWPRALREGPGAAGRRARPRPGRAGDGRRRGAAGRREPVAGAAGAGGGAAGPAARAAGADGGREMRADPARRGGSGLPAGAADQCGRAALPGRRRGRAVADRGRGAGRGDRRRAEPGQLASGGRPSARSTRRPRRRGASCPRSCARRRAWSSPARAGTRAWSGSSPRGWSSATTGRWSSISLDGEGGGRGSGRSIPGFDLLGGARGLLRAPGELRRPPRRRRAVAAGREPRRLPRGLRRPRRPRCSGPRTCGGPSGSTRWSAASASASTWPRSWAGWPRSGWATRACG